LVSGLILPDEDGELLSDDDIAGLMFVLLTAGHETTTGALGTCVAFLAENVALQRELRTQPELIPRAVEEILRRDSPVQMLSRIVTRDVELRSCTLHAGDLVALMFISGNRDVDEFSDPEEFDLWRTQKSMAFGHGIHFCVGAPLARLELRVMIEEFLARTASFQLDGDIIRYPWPLYGVSKLPLRITPAT
jgi:cytochrome P450